MVLELHVPDGATWRSLGPVAPLLLAYALSFVNLAIYWNNHHHMLLMADRVNGGILWANNNLLFWLSLFPFTTAWMGEQGYAPVPVAAYGVASFLAAIAYYLLQRAIIKEHGPRSKLAQAVGGDGKGKLSPVAYLVAIPLAFIDRWISVALYVLVAIMWLTPDKRIEAAISDHSQTARTASEED
jgi:uncharacterized membrane protein